MSRDRDPVMRRRRSNEDRNAHDAHDGHLDSHRLEGGLVPSARPARKTSLFGKPTFGGPTETKKPGPSLLQDASPVGRGAPGFLRLPVCLLAVNWPLVQIPADRHATTGTCVLGRSLFVRIAAESKRFFSHGGKFPNRHKNYIHRRSRKATLASAKSKSGRFTKMTTRGRGAPGAVQFCSTVIDITQIWSRNYRFIVFTPIVTIHIRRNYRSGLCVLQSGMILSCKHAP